MNRYRSSLCWMGMTLLAVLFLASPALAQEEAEADTIYFDGGVVVIQMDDDGRRIIIHGIDVDDLDSRAHVWRFGLDDDLKVFRNHFGGQLSRFEVRTPDLEHLLDRDWSGMVGFAPRLENDGIVTDWLRGFEFGLQGSMKERSEIAKMERDSRRLAREARQADGAERDRLEQELDEKLSEIFDRKQASQEERIERLREELNNTLEKHNERNQDKQEIIERRLRELLGKENKYDW